LLGSPSVFTAWDAGSTYWQQGESQLLLSSLAPLGWLRCWLRCAQTYDVVLIAVPGFGDRAEATSLVWASDKVVLCLEPDHDTRSAVLSMVQLVRDLELAVLGAVTVGTFEGISTTRVVSSVVVDPPPLLVAEAAPLAMTAATVSAGAVDHSVQQSETAVPSFREVSQEG
jgi:MinD-like ATPase involved in chromosome partitioning or flagellar assembly